MAEIGDGFVFTVNAGDERNPANVDKGQLEHIAANAQGTLKSGYASVIAPDTHPGGWLYAAHVGDYFYWKEIVSLTKEGRLPLAFFEHLSDESIANDDSSDITSIGELLAIASRRQLEHHAVEEHGVSRAVVAGYL